MPAHRSRILGAALVLWPLVSTPVHAAADVPAAPMMVGLAPLPFEARNEGDGPMDCAVATAHWYSVDLGRVAPGAFLRQMFWAVPATGEVVILNAQGDRMPVQALWCGRAGRAWDTRAAIGFERRAHRDPSPIRVACRDDGAALRCAPLGPGQGR